MQTWIIHHVAYDLAFHMRDSCYGDKNGFDDNGKMCLKHTLAYDLRFPRRHKQYLEYFETYLCFENSVCILVEQELEQLHIRGQLRIHVHSNVDKCSDALDAIHDAGLDSDLSRNIRFQSQGKHDLRGCVCPVVWIGVSTGFAHIPKHGVVIVTFGWCLNFSRVLYIE
jgi:hypothetical protein